jgi:hypothetical protein
MEDSRKAQRTPPPSIPSGDYAVARRSRTRDGVAPSSRRTTRATITYWESEQAAVESREAANRVRSEATERASGSITSVEEFEVALKE